MRDIYLTPEQVRAMSTADLREALGLERVARFSRWSMPAEPPRDSEETVCWKMP